MVYLIYNPVVDYLREFTNNVRQIQLLRYRDEESSRCLMFVIKCYFHFEVALYGVARLKCNRNGVAARHYKCTNIKLAISSVPRSIDASISANTTSIRFRQTLRAPRTPTVRHDCVPSALAWLVTKMSAWQCTPLNKDVGCASQQVRRK